MTTGIRAIVVGMIANILMSLFKFAGGILGNSVALVADAIHSLSDLVTDIIVLFTHRIGKIPQDKDHPYGHGRAETIGATVIGLLIIMTGIGVAYETWETIAEDNRQAPGLLAASAALLSILINEGLFEELKKRKSFVKASKKRRLKRENAAKQRIKDIRKLVRKAEQEDQY